MTEQMRTFAAEFDEIANDLADQSHLIGTFFDDPTLRTVANELIGLAFEAALNAEDKPNALYQAAAYLLTFGFYLGREHALRGYAPPVPRRDVLLPDVPDTLDGWL